MQFLTSLFITKFGHCVIHAVMRPDQAPRVLVSKDDPLNEFVTCLDLDAGSSNNSLQPGEFLLDPQKAEHAADLLITGAFEPTGKLASTGVAHQHIPVWRITNYAALAA